MLLIKVLRLILSRLPQMKENIILFRLLMKDCSGFSNIEALYNIFEINREFII